MSLVAGVLLALAFVLATVVMPAVVEQFVVLQLGEPTWPRFGVAFVDPAILVRLTPAIAMVIAWVLAWRHYRRRQGLHR
jgi:ACR3 family arsenite efflux pump ArsB